MKKLLPYIIIFLGFSWIALALTTSTFEPDPTNNSRIRIEAMDVTGDWTGTFDGQQGTYFLDYRNLTYTASSSMAGLQTASNLSSIGTITTGVWNGTAITNANLAKFKEIL